MPAIPFMAAHKQLGVVNPLAQGHWRTCHLLRGSAPTLGSNDHTAEPNAMWPSMGSQVVNDNATHRTTCHYCGHATNTYQCLLPFPMPSCTVEVLMASATQFPLASAQHKHAKQNTCSKKLGMKGQPANANGQCPMRKARRNKLFSFFSQTMSAVMIPHHVQAQWPPAMPSCMPMPRHRLMGYH